MHNGAYYFICIKIDRDYWGDDDGMNILDKVTKTCQNCEDFGWDIETNEPQCDYDRNIKITGVDHKCENWKPIYLLLLEVYPKEIASLKQQLTTAQEENVRLRSALESVE